MVSESAPLPYRFSSAAYHQMGEAGIFPPDLRTELLDGEVLVMPPIGDGHMSGVTVLSYALIIPLLGRALVMTQNPLKLADGSEPVPDAMVLLPRDDYYRDGGVHPEHVLLLIEVSDSTLAYDCGRKLTRYAQAGIPEVWIVDLKGRRLLVYRDPQDSVYHSTTLYGPDDHVSPAAFPDVSISVARITS